MTKKRLVVVVLLLMIEMGIASAQSYQVRVTYNTNLRASYSLESAILASARAGESVLVVGSHERWLRVQRDGREYWMADWVPMTRVDGQQAPSDIDNCCFVDRQCNTDHEWTEGYWAYQRNECGAPISTESTSVTGASPGDVNNCCFIGWHCANDQQWVNGYWAYQNNQCDAGPAVAGADSCCQLGWPCSLEEDWAVGRWIFEKGLDCGAPLQVHLDGTVIEGSEKFIGQVTAALDLLKRRVPHWYAYVVRGVRKIRGLPVGGGTYAYIGTINLSQAHANEATIVFAGTILHESCHVHRILTGELRYNSEDEIFIEENLCETVRTGALEEVDPRRPPNAILERVIAEFFSKGRHFDFAAAANVQRERAFSLLSAMS